MTRHSRVIALASAVLVTASIAGPARADTSPTPAPDPTATAPADPAGTADPTAAATPDTTAAWVECPDTSTECPVAPVGVSTTATVDVVQVAWEWPDGAAAPEGVTSVLVRVSPGDHEVVVDAAETTVAVEGLDAETEYSITILAAAGDRLSVPSAPVLVTTLALVDTGSDVVDSAMMKPVATSGDVESLIVTLVSGPDTSVQAEQATDDLPLAGVSASATQDLGDDTAVIDLSEGVSDADAALIIRDLEADPTVESVSVNQRVRAFTYPATAPDDPRWTDGSLWGLYGTYGIGIGSSPTAMNNVWTSGQGSGAVVAVLDTGSTVHPDLDANYVAGYDFVRSSTSVVSGGYGRADAADSDGDYIDTAAYGAVGWDDNPLDPGDWAYDYYYSPAAFFSSSWHGTHVAGTIAAVGNNSTGVIGIAPQAKIQPVRVLSFGGGWSSDIQSAIKWASGASVPGTAANTEPADVINLSLGASGECTSQWQSAIDIAVGRGTVVVVSAGNSNTDASSFVPANCENVITVAASDSSGIRSYWGSPTRGSNYGSAVEITAPGTGIWSTMNSGSTTPSTPKYISYNGTSMAAPHVSGVAALLKSLDDTLTPSQVLTRLQGSVRAFPITGSAYDCTTSLCGAGLLTAAGAVVSTPSIADISPRGGPTAGGTTVTITGADLDTVTAVTFGGTAATSFTLGSATSLTAVAPAGTAGAVTLEVTNPGGSATTSFTYHDAPAISSVSPSSGTTAGGESVTITGTNLDGTTGVTFGGTAAILTAIDATSVTVATPDHAAGAVDVVVTTPGGSSTLIDAFEFIAPPTSAPPPASAPGSGSSSSSGGSSGGGGGDGLHVIQVIVPQPSGVPGSTIALAGWGLGGTEVVYFNEDTASFRIVSDAEVVVTVPDIPPGVYVIHAQFDPSVGRASYWPGFHVLPKGSAVAPPATGGTNPGTPGSTPSATASAADLVGFKANSSTLTTSTKTRLRRMVAKVDDAEATGTVLVFSDRRGTATSRKVAQARARNIVAYLRSQGVEGEIRTMIEKGSTSTLRKSALVRLTSSPGASVMSSDERVLSLIVRYAKGASPTVDGRVRGSDHVTGGLGGGMTLGPTLGLRTYRVDFASPVTLAQAQKAADQMLKDTGVQVAEPDRIVRATITAN